MSSSISSATRGRKASSKSVANLADASVANLRFPRILESKSRVSSAFALKLSASMAKIFVALRRSKLVLYSYLTILPSFQDEVAIHQMHF